MSMGVWFTEHFGWMYWTWQSAVFFGAILGCIAFLTMVDLRRPAGHRKGWLPIATTRGDRLFLSIIAAIGLHLIWIAVAGLNAVWAASLGAVVLAVALFWRG